MMEDMSKLTDAQLDRKIDWGESWLALCEKDIEAARRRYKERLAALAEAEEWLDLCELDLDHARERCDLFAGELAARQYNADLVAQEGPQA